MAFPEPRQHLKRLIEEKVRGSATALTDLPYDVVPYIADAVMDLFPDVAREWRSEDKAHPMLWMKSPWEATHTRYVLRTSPEPIQEAPHA